MVGGSLPGLESVGNCRDPPGLKSCQFPQKKLEFQGSDSNISRVYFDRAVCSEKEALKKMVKYLKPKPKSFRC